MRPLSEFLRLPPADRRLLILALLAVSVFRVVVRVAPFPWLWRVLNIPSRRRASGADEMGSAVDRIRWAVSVAGSKTGASCIPRALAACVLLRGAGVPCRVKVGVRHAGEDPLRGHMWVESLGRVVSGDVTELADYVCLLDTGAARPTLADG